MALTVPKPPPLPPGAIIAHVSPKGGVHKSDGARDTAFELGSTIVDFEWGKGSLSEGWGYSAERAIRSPLLDYFDKGKMPKPLHGLGKSPLIPYDPAFGTLAPEAKVITNALHHWAATLGTSITVDNHNDDKHRVIRGAMDAAHLNVVPVLMTEASVRAAEQMYTDFGDYPLLFVPHLLAERHSVELDQRLHRIVRSHGYRLGPDIPYCKYLPGYKRRMPPGSGEVVPDRFHPYINAIRTLAQEVYNRVTAAA